MTNENVVEALEESEFPGYGKIYKDAFAEDGKTRDAVLCIDEEDESIVPNKREKETKSSTHKASKSKKEEIIDPVCLWCQKKTEECKCPDECMGCKAKKGTPCTCTPETICPGCNNMFKDCKCCAK